MTAHFSRMQQFDQYPTLQRNSPFKRGHEENLHNVEILRLSWQENIHNSIDILRENMSTYIEE